MRQVAERTVGRVIFGGSSQLLGHADEGGEEACVCTRLLIVLREELLETSLRLRIRVRLPPPQGLRRAPHLQPGARIGEDVPKLNLELPEVADKSPRIVSTSRLDLGEDALT